MLCSTCGQTLTEDAKTCDSCEGTLILAKPRNPSLAPVVSPSEVPPVAHAHLLYEQVWQTLTDFQARQQNELAQLRGELEGKIQSLTPKPKVENKHHLKISINDSSAIILSFLLVGLIGFIWLVSLFINYNQAIRFDNIAVLASTLTVIGSLYLAYDLLGRQHGPLRWLAIFVTSGLIGAIILEPAALVFATLENNIPDAFRILLVGILLGAFSGILFAIPENPRHPHIFSGKASMIGGLLGIVFLAALLRVFYTPIAPVKPFDPSITDQYLQILLVATLFGVPLGVVLGGFHHFFRGNYQPGRPQLFSWRSSLKAFGIILVFWGVIALLALAEPAAEKKAIYDGTLAVLAVALSGAIPSGFAPYMFWGLNHFPERTLGASGFVLTLIGAMLPAIQPIVDILSVLKK